MVMEATLPPTVLRIHYKTKFGDSVSVRGSAEGLSWEVGTPATWTNEMNKKNRCKDNNKQEEMEEEDVWQLELNVVYSSSPSFSFKPLLNDLVWAKGADYIGHIGKTTDIYPFFNNENGTITRHLVPSSILSNERITAVYLPPSYYENPFKTYPLLIMQDGHNLFDCEDSFTSEHWRIGEAMDKLCTSGGISEYIVVGPYPVDREFEYLPVEYNTQGGGSDKYLDFLTKELRPFISQHYRIQPGPDGIGGSSYGGIIAFYAWVMRPNDFHLCGAFSPSMKWGNRVMFDIAQKHLKKRLPEDKIYLDSGTIKDESRATYDMKMYLSKTDFITKDQMLYVKAEGHEHSEYHWALRAPKALSFLLADSDRNQPSCEDPEP